MISQLSAYCRASEVTITWCFINIDYYHYYFNSHTKASRQKPTHQSVIGQYRFLQLCDIFCYTHRNQHQTLYLPDLNKSLQKRKRNGLFSCGIVFLLLLFISLQNLPMQIPLRDSMETHFVWPLLISDRFSSQNKCYAFFN